MYNMATTELCLAVVLCFMFTQGSIFENKLSRDDILTRVPVERRSKLIIDHDGGADDAMAIFIALLYEKYFNGPQVVGITTSHANVDEPQAFINTQRVLNIANRRDVPVYRGSNHSLVYDVPSDNFFGFDGLGDSFEKFEELNAKPEHAVWALIELAKKFQEDLIIVASGALTNIALALRLYPNFIQRIGHLYIAAGNVYGGGSSYGTRAEFNAKNDVESYYIVTRFATPDKVTVVPFSQIRGTLNFTMGWRVNVLGSIPTNIIKAQNAFERVSMTKESSFWAMLDPATIAIALDNSVADNIMYSNNSIVLTGEDRGINYNRFTDRCNANVQLVYSCNQQTYRNMLLSIFTAELSPQDLWTWTNTIKNFQ